MFLYTRAHKRTTHTFLKIHHQEAHRNPLPRKATRTPLRTIRAQMRTLIYQNWSMVEAILCLASSLTRAGISNCPPDKCAWDDPRAPQTTYIPNPTNHFSLLLATNITTSSSWVSSLPVKLLASSKPARDYLGVTSGSSSSIPEHPANLHIYISNLLQKGILISLAPALTLVLFSYLESKPSGFL